MRWKKFLATGLMALACLGTSYAGTPYYVNTSAASGGDGTTTALSGATGAWNELTDITSISAGDFVFLNRGDTFRQSAAWNPSGLVGTQTSRITVSAYGTATAAKPDIRGSQIVGATWDQTVNWIATSAANSWYTLTAASVSAAITAVYLDDARMDESEAASTTDILVAGDWFSSGTAVLIIYATADPSTLYDVVEGVTHTAAMWTSNDDYVKFINLQFSHAKNGAQLTSSSTGLVFQSCDFHDCTTWGLLANNEGVAMKDCKAYTNVTGGVSVVDDVIGSDIEGGEFYANINGAGTSGAAILIDNSKYGTVRRANIHDNFYGIHLQGEAGDLTSYYTLNRNKLIDNKKPIELDGLVHFCTVDGNVITGTVSQSDIYLNGSTQNSTISRNTISASLDTTNAAIRLRDASTETVIYNIIIGANKGVDITGTASAPAITVYNNVIYDTAFGINVDSGMPLVHLTVKNNIVDNPEWAFIRIASTSGVTLVSDYNNWSGTGQKWNYNDVCYSFAGFKNQTSTDGNSTTLAPGFVNAGSGNFALLAGSPNIDSGVDVSIVRDAIFGIVPQNTVQDKGAFEFVAE